MTTYHCSKDIVEQRAQEVLLRQRSKADKSCERRKHPTHYTLLGSRMAGVTRIKESIWVFSVIATRNKVDCTE